MKEFVQDTVTNRFAQLPEAVQDLILSEILATEMNNALVAADLTGDSYKECNQQVTLVLVGLSTTKDLKEYVLSNLKIDEQKAQTLYNNLVSNVILPVRDVLLKSFNSKKPEAADTTLREGISDPYREQIT